MFRSPGVDRENRPRQPESAPLTFVPIASLAVVDELLPAQEWPLQSRHVWGSTTAAPMPSRPTSYRSEAKHVARCADALTWPTFGPVVTMPGQILTETTTTLRWGMPRLDGIPGLVSVAGGVSLDPTAIATAPVLDNPAMTFCNVSRNVYGHWLMDCLPAVAMLRGRVRAEGRMLLAPPLKPWHRETLSRLGVLDLVREIEEPIVRVRDLLVSGFVDSSDVQAPSAGAQATFQALGAGVSPGSDKLLYISRRGGLRRAMRNESDLEAMLARVGFVAIQPETLSIADQAAAFAGARVVVGAHGSGMANIGFAPAGCVVAEIVPSGFYGEWIERLATVLGHAYTEIVVATDSDAVEVIESGAKRFRPDWSYEVEVDRIVEAVKAAMF